MMDRWEGPELEPSLRVAPLLSVLITTVCGILALGLRPESSLFNITEPTSRAVTHIQLVPYLLFLPLWLFPGAEV